MKISNFICAGKEPHSFTMEIPDGVSYEDFTKNSSCSECGNRLIKTEKNNSDGENRTNRI